MSLAGLKTYLRPTTVEEAYAALGEGVRPVAGGTALMLHPPHAAHTLVDLTSTPLRYIEADGSGFRLGAMATLTDMLEHPGLSIHQSGVVATMLARVGSPLLRNLATLGGHLARGRLSDVVPVLLALDATVTVFDGGGRTMPLAEFYATGLHHNRMLLTEVQIPAAPAGSAAAYVKFDRTAYDTAMLNCACAAQVVDGVVQHARVALGETPWLGARVQEAEEALVGRELNDAAIREAAAVAAAVTPFDDDARAGRDYRRHLGEVAVRRSLARIRDELG